MRADYRSRLTAAAALLLIGLGSDSAPVPLARPSAAAKCSMGPRPVAGNTARGTMLRRFAHPARILTVCSAELVLLGGRIVTMNPEMAEAQALACREGRIVGIGSDSEIKRHVGPDTCVINLAGRLVIPGFIEGHGHFVSLGRSKMELDLTRAKSWDEIAEIVRQAAKRAEPGEWIVGGGWHQEKWDATPQPNVQGYPTHDALTDAAPQNPVLLSHRTGHMCVANRKAMQLAGIDENSADPAGGIILRDTKRHPTGVFRETAQAAVERAYAKSLSDRTSAQQEANLVRAVKLASAECLAKGITSFQDAGLSFATIDCLKRLADRNELKLRLWVMVSESNTRLREQLAAHRTVDYGNCHLTVRAIKRMVDGALGSHGAWMLKPYDDLSTSCGLVVQSVDSIREAAKLAVQNDCQLCVHAIGDRANREILDLYESVFRHLPEKKNLRWRIEHAQHLHPHDIPRFAQLGVIASMQGVHCTSDAPFVVHRLGVERAKTGAYAWRSLLESGARIANGTDVPVEDVSPILSFHASVSRRVDDNTVFFSEQRMNRTEALRSYTLDAAYAAFEEDSKGSLTLGKLADIVVLSKDILTVPEREIPTAEVLYTIVGGKIMYEK